MVFGFGKPHFLGIDFGTASIKAVELSVEDGHPVLTNYGQISLSDLEKGTPAQGRSYDEEIVLHLQALIERMKPKSRAAYVAMPAFIGLISLVEFPVMEESELEEAVRFEAHKYIPSSLDDVALSWEVIERRGAPGGEEKMEVLLVAALNKEVARYERYINKAGLTVDFLELETFSLARSIVGEEPGLSLMIDIGSRATNLVLIENGLVRVSRNLDIGGRDITRTLAESLSITQERSKVLKKSGKDFLTNPQSALVFPVLQMIAGEATRILASYQAKHSGVQCKNIILSGGTAQFTGLVKYYTDIFKLPVVLGNSWRNIKYDPRLAKKIQESGTSFSIAAGLALRGTETVLKKKENLFPVSKKKFSLKELFTRKI
ncbi:MAG: type IV pilus assembly protein PilM [Candidatus Moranbacteria bacterium]|nr:type IV pilus assembly protein PilM [Candidatus Moranbacteria bacterium]